MSGTVNVPHPQSIREMAAFVKKPPVLGPLGAEHLPFLALYVVAVVWCAATIGRPHQLAMDELFDKPVDESRPETLPPPYLADYRAMLLLALTPCLHILMALAQHWSIGIRCRVQYSPVKELRGGVYLKVTPKRSQFGVTELVPVTASVRHLSEGRRQPLLYFTFQKRKYVYNGVAVEKVKCPAKLPLRQYVTARGFVDDDELQGATERFGPNKFEIPMPAFGELYRKQLLAPLSVFQLFCSLLWFLDEMWKYAFFALFSVLVFEGSSVFTRLKNVQMLRGIGNQGRRIKVLRKGQWAEVSTDDLLPGDIVSIHLERGANDVVPCDCLVLQGNAVVNEATLTGESTPQMKEAVSHDPNGLDRALDIKSADRANVLYGGTTLLQQTGTTEDTAAQGQFPPAPDTGCICYVLRTGFASSQGKLVRMIEFASGDRAGTDKQSVREALLLIGMLVMLAFCAAGYVLKKGLESGRATQYELLLHCVLILTSVVPADLPMQLAYAVNVSLLSLMRKGIVCTEPFRLPMAGNLDICLFDKTGTITTDQLEAVGVTPWPGNGELQDMIEAPLRAGVILGGCHSLIDVDGKIVGDPLELISLRTIGWEYNHAKQTAVPDKKQHKERHWNNVQVHLIHRYRFQSKLQRMTVIARVTASDGDAQLRVLVKGSPEMTATLLAESPDAKPEWYDAAYQALARKGMRVIALASRSLNSEEAQRIANSSDLSQQPRDWLETGLTFAGFVAFRCPIRRDSAEIITSLRSSNHTVAMITGDSILTAAYVAAEVGMRTAEEKGCLVLKGGDNASLKWVDIVTDATVAPFSAAALPELRRQGYTLCVNGPALAAASAADPEIWKHVRHIAVFARATPDQKEQVLHALNSAGHHTLMCGDGANDVGALKQASVGVALLTGFGNLNTGPDPAAPPANAPATPGGAVVTPAAPQPPAPVKPQMPDRQQMMEELQRETERLQAEGVGLAQFKAMMNVVRKHQEENRKKVAERGGAFGMSAAAAAAKEDGSAVMDEMPVIKPGDASVAAPFTSRSPSIRGVTDIIRQGRTTLVTSVQNNQILCVNCLISSFSLSVLYLEGVKFGDYQMTATGLLLTVSHLAVSHARPLEQISPVRPLRSVFHPALFASLCGQFAIHLSCMLYALRGARTYMPEDYKPALKGEFKPNMINTVVFLVETVQQVCVILVNYKGRPFMPGLTESAALLQSLGLCMLGTLVCAYEVVPDLNSFLELTPFPSDDFRTRILITLATNVVAALCWDRLVVAIFAPQIFKASIEQISVWDLVAGFRKIAFFSGAIAVFLLTDGGSLLPMIMAYLAYRRFQRRDPAPPQQQQQQQAAGAPTPAPSTSSSSTAKAADSAAGPRKRKH